MDCAPPVHALAHPGNALPCLRSRAEEAKGRASAAQPCTGAGADRPSNRPRAAVGYVCHSSSSIL